MFFFLTASIVHVCSYFQQFLVSLFSVAPGDVCPRASTPVKGPRSQPISLGPALTELSCQRERGNSHQTVICRGRGGWELMLTQPWQHRETACHHLEVREGFLEEITSNVKPQWWTGVNQQKWEEGWGTGFQAEGITCAKTHSLQGLFFPQDIWPFPCFSEPPSWSTQLSIWGLWETEGTCGWSVEEAWGLLGPGSVPRILRMPSSLECSRWHLEQDAVHSGI